VTVTPSLPEQKGKQGAKEGPATSKRAPTQQKALAVPFSSPYTAPGQHHCWSLFWYDSWPLGHWFMFCAIAVATSRARGARWMRDMLIRVLVLNGCESVRRVLPSRCVFVGLWLFCNLQRRPDPAWSGRCPARSFISPSIEVIYAREGFRRATDHTDERNSHDGTTRVEANNAIRVTGHEGRNPRRLSFTMTGNPARPTGRH
jgi:hypothetical protein